MQDSGTGGGHGLYVHWPFCLSKCPYCDFNSHVASDIDHGRWRHALVRELETLAARQHGSCLGSVFFGGGTPSLMQPETVAAILETARTLWPSRPDLEVTMEANPTSVEIGRFRDFRDAGINRVSVGVQSLDDAALSFLGRGHSASEAVSALEVARNCFERFSFDLIYARPDQTVASWIDELTQALTLAGDHLSLYQLTIEPGTAFHARHQRGDFSVPDDDVGGALYEVTGEALSKAGMPAYEISNHARPGAECRHNLIYWRTEDYLGIGPGAHGRLTDRSGHRWATRTHRAPAVWLDRVDRDGHAIVEDTRLGRSDQVTEMLMMGLRLAEGVSACRVRREIGRAIDELFDPRTIADLVAENYLTVDARGLRATPAGLQRLNGVLGLLLDGLRIPG